MRSTVPHYAAGLRRRVTAGRVSVDFDSYASPDGQSLLRAAKARLAARSHTTRTVVTEAVAAAATVGLALGLALAGSSQQTLSVSRLAICVIAFLVVARARFPVASGWTRPTQLVLVSMLFVLPTQIVPAVVAACMVLNMWPDVLAGRRSVARTFAVFADGANALGPAAVLVLSGNTRFAWSHWPVYALALVAQFAVDYGQYALRTRFADGAWPRAALEASWAYVTDGCLACTGLLVVPAVIEHPGVLLLVLPMAGLFGLFAREREQRLDQTLELSSAYRGTAMLLSDVVEADHEYTGIHCREVVELSVKVARALRLNASEQLNVEFGALLHDVGKIRVPAEIIDKPGPLDDAEWAVMREHTIYGQEMLEKVGGTLSRVGRVVRASHEHFDGGGYPDRLAGREIPIEARIVSACDAYNAMTTTRSYRAGMPPSAALDELRRCAGTQFDPDVVQAIVRQVGLVP